ncbi:hypothetical protein VNO77_04104 [Canavalia gladiata]|uniref:Uncharacterized protein n=1 Tax=Canavalia gladiata TaxID=3824 RepID=A0AAN9MWM1_CANGL
MIDLVDPMVLPGGASIRVLFEMIFTSQGNPLTPLMFLMVVEGMKKIQYLRRKLWSSLVMASVKDMITTMVKSVRKQNNIVSTKGEQLFTVTKEEWCYSWWSRGRTMTSVVELEVTRFGEKR